MILLLREQIILFAHQVFLLLDNIASLFTINRAHSDAIAINQPVGLIQVQVNQLGV